MLDCKSALVKILAWHLSGTRPLSEPMMTKSYLVGNELNKHPAFLDTGTHQSTSAVKVLSFLYMMEFMELSYSVVWLGGIVYQSHGVPLIYNGDPL